MRDKKPTFLILATYADSVINFRGHLICDLIARGQEVHVAAPGLLMSHGVVKKLSDWGARSHNIKIDRSGLSIWSEWNSLISIYKLIRDISPNNMLSYGIKAVIYGTFLGAICGVKARFILVAGLGFIFENHNKKYLIKYLIKKLYKYSLNLATLVFFQNNDDRVELLHSYILSPRIDAVVVNGSGVDLEYFSYRPIVAGRGVNFLMIARLLKSKGVYEYVEVAARVRAQYPDVEFALAGWIDNRVDSVQYAELERWRSDGIIKYLGRLEDVRGAIEDSSIFVLPSYREGTPRSVLEAMALGRPIITTDAPGCRQTVINGVNGYTVPVASVDALCSAVMKFLLHPEVIPKMGFESRQLAEDRYDVHKVNAKMLSKMGISKC